MKREDVFFIDKNDQNDLYDQLDFFFNYWNSTPAMRGQYAGRFGYNSKPEKLSEFMNILGDNL